MEKKENSEGAEEKIFHVLIGDEIAKVEMISALNNIYVVEIAGKDIIFISQVRSEDNSPRWISIPQGNNELAEFIGQHIEKKHKKGHES